MTSIVRGTRAHKYISEGPPGNKKLEAGESSRSKKKKSKYAFSFRITQTKKFKSAISALAEPELNPSGLAMMEVDKAGFELTVNTIEPAEFNQEEVFALLSLKSTGLIEFECHVPMKKMFSVASLNKFLEKKAGEEDIVIKVYSRRSSNSLCVKFRKPSFGIPLPFNFEARFSNARCYHKFPVISYGFETVMPTNKLETMLKGIMDMLPRRRPPFVSLSINSTLTLKSGKDFEMKVDWIEKVWFCFPYWPSLQKAAPLAENFLVWVVTNPKQGAMLRFDLQELGDMIYLKFPSSFFIGRDLPFIGSFRPLSYVSLGSLLEDQSM